MAATRPDIELQPTVNVKTTKALQTGCVHIEQMKLARQQRFGKKCESLAGMQRSLFEEDVDADIAEISAYLDRLLPQTGDEEKTTTRPVRKALPSHLPRVEKVIPAAEERCPECNEFLRFIRKRLVRTVLIFTESSDQLSRATDRVPGLPASPGYVQ